MKGEILSKKTREFFEQLKAGGEQSMGAIEAVKEGIQAVAPGLSLSNILSDIGAELGRLGVQGQMEMASALFNGNAFVPYGPGQYTPTQEQAPHHGLPIEAMKQPEVQQEQSRGGREM
jgi:hypothetical protein